MPQFRFNTVQRSEIERSPGGASMLNAIDNDDDCNLIVTGLPGSGKTTVTLKRAERLRNQGKKILVITFHNLLCKGLINASDQNLENAIKGLYRWFYQNYGWLDHNDTAKDMKEKMRKSNLSQYDEVLIDEGQDFESRVYESLSTICKRMTAGADNAQKLRSCGLQADEIKDHLEDVKRTISYPLDYNYRNTFQILNFARFFLPENERVNNEQVRQSITRKNGEKPKVYQVASVEEENQRLKTILEENENNNVAILFHSQKEVDNYFERIQALGIDATPSKWHNQYTPEKITNILVTTFKSAKGLEFNVVILPEMESAMKQEQLTPEHYYVACTRAVNKLYLMYNNDVIPGCFKEFDPESYEHIGSEMENKQPIIPDDDLPF